MNRKLLLPLVLLTAVLLSCLPVSSVPHAYAADLADGSGLPLRSGEQIAELWKKLMNPTTDYRKPYTTNPKITNPYAPGALKTDYIQDGVNAVNFYRFISGLPYDITMDATLNAQAQYGALLLAASGDFSHYPTKPDDMPESIFRRGEDATSSSNIFASTYNDHIVVSSVDAYMEDSDTYNLDRVGHRRWILNPPLQKVGFGQAEGQDNGGYRWKYSALKIFDESRIEAVDYNYIAYPAAGPFPIEVFGGYYAWSVSINPDKYDEPVISNVKVTMKRLNDNKTWTLTSANNTVSETGAYMNVENSNFGSGPAIIFRPSGNITYQSGDRFRVTITGLKSVWGESRTLEYEVEFMSAEEYVPAQTPTQTPTQPAANARFTDIAKHWARETIEWAADRGITDGYANGTFKPNDNVTEEEFLKMFIASFNISVPATGANERWSAGYYAYAANNGYNLRGSMNETIRRQPISRLSVAELIASAAGLPYSGDSAIQYLLDNDYSQGKTSATVEGYQGSANLTRAEAVQFIRNLIDQGFTL